MKISALVSLVTLALLASCRGPAAPDWEDSPAPPVASRMTVRYVPSQEHMATLAGYIGQELMAGAVFDSSFANNGQYVGPWPGPYDNWALVIYMIRPNGAHSSYVWWSAFRREYIPIELP